MEKKTLSNLMEGKIFQIPDYQRGYAWEEKQWKDFVQDIDALIDDQIISHYTGTIVIFQPLSKPTENYGTKRLELVDIVDGQQRLTTCSIYLSIILDELIKRGNDEYRAELPIYLFNGTKSKLRLNNDTSDFFYDLISKGTTNTQVASVHQKRLLEGYNYLKAHLKVQILKRNSLQNDYLIDLFDALIRKLSFSFYPIEVESEIGMTFELMNSRGKELSSLELLKNYLMYWVYRNIPEINEKEDLTNSINKTWKEVYTNIVKCNGSENQCLRIAWTLYQSHTPKNWKGYIGFKEDDVIPLRDFSKKSHSDTKEFIYRFTNGLAEVSRHYSEILSPNLDNTIISEVEWLNKIKNAGNIANFLPLLVAVRIKYTKDNVPEGDYINILKALEKFSYRVYLWNNKRSNTGISQFYKWADDIFTNKQHIENVIIKIFGLLNWYCNEHTFRKVLQEEFFDWYYERKLLKYTLFEYELWLLKSEGKKSKPKLSWEDLSDSTIEHILPQNPDKKSLWKKKWNRKDINNYLHDVSNLVLTKDNSHYLNFEFDRKKRISGIGHCYSNSDIRQERKIAEYDDWIVENCEDRRIKIVEWIIGRWGVDQHFKIPEDVEEVEVIEIDTI